MFVAVGVAGTRARPAQIVGQAAADTASSTTFVPLTPSYVDTSKSTAAAKAQAKTVQEPVYQFSPVLSNSNSWLWQFLHSVLMLLSFCFLLPLGSLLARHKWIFGRDPLSVSTLSIAAVTCLQGLVYQRT